VAADRQEVAGLPDPVVLAVMAGLSLVLLSLLPLAVSSSEPGQLESDNMCGVTTGGQV
jgi:hypothetical protein